jgi:predicted DNA-binding protein
MKNPLNFGVMNTETTTVSFRFPKGLIDVVDAHAKRETRTRANMTQVLLQEALEARLLREMEQIPNAQVTVHKKVKA